MNDELERTCKETVVTQTTYCRTIFLERLGKTTKISAIVAGRDSNRNLSEERFITLSNRSAVLFREWLYNQSLNLRELVIYLDFEYFFNTELPKILALFVNMSILVLPPRIYMYYCYYLLCYISWRK